MAAKKASQAFNVGDRVKILHSDWRGRIVELRGPLGPGGMLIYRVRIPHKPKPIYIEVGQDQLRAIPTPPRLGPSLLLTSPRIEPHPPTIQPKKSAKRQ
jgi:hypothetical protein